jgi:two-component system CheB/CheR fusion protein
MVQHDNTAIEHVIEGAVLTFVDITEVKISRDKLSISELNYRTIFETSKEGILILDGITGKIKDVNPFLTDLLGYTSAQFIEKEIWDIGLFKDIIANKDKFAELQEKKYSRYENLPLETSGGKKVDVEFISNVYELDQVRIVQCNIRETINKK